MLQHHTLEREGRGWSDEVDTEGPRSARHEHVMSCFNTLSLLLCFAARATPPRRRSSWLPAKWACRRPLPAIRLPIILVTRQRSIPYPPDCRLRRLPSCSGSAFLVLAKNDALDSRAASLLASTLGHQNVPRLTVSRVKGAELCPGGMPLPAGLFESVQWKQSWFVNLDGCTL